MMATDEQQVKVSILEDVNPLHSAIKQGNTKKLKLLLNDKRNINEKDDHGRTALYLACEKNQIECLSILIEKEADLNIPDNTGKTPAYTALLKGYYKCAQKLLDRNATVEDFKTSLPEEIQQFHDSVNSGNIEQFKTFIQGENAFKLVNAEDKWKRTAVHYAAEKNHFEILKILLKIIKDNVNVNSNGNADASCTSKKDSSNGTSNTGNANSDGHGNGNVKAFNKPDLYGMTPAHVAAQNNSVECLKILLSNRIDLSVRNCYDQTIIDVIFSETDNPEEHLMAALDCRIQMKREKKIEKFKFDFDILSPRECDITSKSKLLSSPHNLEQMNITSNMIDVCNEKQIEIIFQHPIFKIFLSLKNEKHFFLYCAQMMMLLIYWFLLYFYFMLLKDTKWNQELSVARFVISVITAMRCMFGLLKFATLPRTSLMLRKSFIITNLLTPSTILVILVIEFISNVLHSVDMMENHVVYLMSVASILICIEPFLFLTKFSLLENYIEMFFVISKKVIILFFMFFWILFGFAVSFRLLFNHYNPFSDLISSIFKTVVMMTGEFEYEAIFSNDQVNNTQVAERLVSPIPKIIFVLFINLIYVVVGNLMIGVAVQDVSDLKPTFYVKRLQYEAERFQQIETFFIWLVENCKLEFVKYIALWFLKHSYVEKERTLTSSQISAISSDLLCSIKNRIKEQTEQK